MRNLALEVAQSGVTANSIALGLMNNVSEEILPMLEKTIPVGRAGDPDEIGACCVYLASDEASFVNGAVFVVDGGLTVGPARFGLAEEIAKPGGRPGGKG